jgi:hypothetical protein
MPRDVHTRSWGVSHQRVEEGPVPRRIGGGQLAPVGVGRGGEVWSPTHTCRPALGNAILLSSLSARRSNDWRRGTREGGRSPAGGGQRCPIERGAESSIGVARGSSGKGGGNPLGSYRGRGWGWAEMSIAPSDATATGKMKTGTILRASHIPSPLPWGAMRTNATGVGETSRRDKKESEETYG